MHLGLGRRLRLEVPCELASVDRTECREPDQELPAQLEVDNDTFGETLTDQPPEQQFCVGAGSDGGSHRGELDA